MPSDNPKDRIGILKPRLSLVPKSAIIRIAQAFTDGARKYGPFNWREKKVSATVYIDAAERHLAAYYDGEDVAADSGVGHLAHAGACIALLIDATETGNLIDDRPVPGKAGELIAALTEKPDEVDATPQRPHETASGPTQHREGNPIAVPRPAVPTAVVPRTPLVPVRQHVSAFDVVGGP